MKINFERLTLFAPAITRIGMSLVFLWFGFQQFLHTTSWIGFIPQWIIKYSPVDAVTLVHFNGAVELVFGFALLFGLFVRTTATILALHMAHITLIVGYDAIGVRDFGLVVATSGVALYGPDLLSVEQFLFSKNIFSDTQPKAEPIPANMYAYTPPPAPASQTPVLSVPTSPTIAPQQPTPPVAPPTVPSGF